MKKSIVELIKESIVLEYNLPCDIRKFEKTVLSSRNDNCYSTRSNEDLSSIIYNNIIHYAFDTFEMGIDDEVLLTRALNARIKYSEVAEKDKLSLGFFGEVLLYSILHSIYKVHPAISKGHFYIIGNGESKGYDSYHLVEANGHIHLWFGEVKFRNTSPSCIKDALENLSNKILTDNYFIDNNIVPIFDEMSKSTNYNTLPDKLQSIKNKWIEKGSVTMDDFINNNIKLVYPILIIFNQSKRGYDASIQNCINYIKANYSSLTFDKISLDTKIFFVFMPVEDVKAIKEKVIKWIELKEPLM